MNRMVSCIVAMLSVATGAAAQSGRVSTRCGIDVALVAGQPTIYSDAQDITVSVHEGDKRTSYSVSDGQWQLDMKPVAGNSVTVGLGADVQEGAQPENTCGFRVDRDQKGIFVEVTTFFRDPSGKNIFTSSKKYLQ